ncbi:MAG: hypothetical protein OXI43_13525 [Candidatus Poribacteria bacterium]|nr:hypothetical protein [Candidatus Poribacteria bacterium]
MWIIFETPDKPIDFVLLAVHTESLVELLLGKTTEKFQVTLQKPFDAHGSNHSSLYDTLGIFDTYNEGLTFALDIIESLKSGKPALELPQYVPQNTKKEIL